MDGSRGADVAAEAGALAERLADRGIPCGISRWDASGLFAELLLAEPSELVVSPRVLALLYAADLVFRIRWEIRPALQEGRVMIAAPYVHTAVAVGVGLELPEHWLREVFRFATPADALRLAREGKQRRGWRPKPARGYAECCASLLDDAPAGLRRRKSRTRAMAWLARATGGTALTRRMIVEQLADYRQPSGSDAPRARAASQRT